MYVNARATCHSRILIISWVSFKSLYNWNSCRNASLLLQLPLKTAGVFPLRAPFCAGVAIGVGGAGGFGWVRGGGGPVGCTDATTMWRSCGVWPVSDVSR